MRERRDELAFAIGRIDARGAFAIGRGRAYMVSDKVFAYLVFLGRGLVRGRAFAPLLSSFVCRIYL